MSDYMMMAWALIILFSVFFILKKIGDAKQRGYNP